MRTAVRRSVPVVAWGGYVVCYPLLERTFGQYADMLALLPVAASAWAWGLAAGVLAGLAGYVLAGLLVTQLSLQEWSRSFSLDGPEAFRLLAFLGTGVCVAFVQRFREAVDRERLATKRAQVDPLTGALTRGAFEERLRLAVEQAAAQGSGLALLFVDLDRFKFVNDTFGHEAGDKLLREVGRVLRQNVRAQDLLGRIGGDEFTVALMGVTDERAAAAVARGLVRELSEPVRIDGRDVQVSASIGIALYPRDGDTAEGLLKSADAAMYEVKEGGKNSYYFSSVEVRTRLSRRLELERQLRAALHANELAVVYQPQVRLADNRLVGFEALLRWRSPELGDVSPGEFVPVAEEAGLISSIGHWLLSEVAHRLRDWLGAGLTPVKLAVNVSTMQFHQRSFVDTVRSVVNDTGVPPQLLEIEVTESVLVRDYELALRTLLRLERLGVRTALDDFGTGYSSLAYLQRLPIDALKIDRSFVHGLSPQPLHTGVRVPNVSSNESDPGLRRYSVMQVATAVEPSARYAGLNVPTSTLPIVEAMCAMAHKLGKRVVAEGIETAYQRDFLKRLGVDFAQGYFFSRPMSAVDAEAVLRRVTEDLERERRLLEAEPPGRASRTEESVPDVVLPAGLDDLLVP